jgi:enamine deaminase RidA (YjgF/YER057c/UK114 family)
MTSEEKKQRILVNPPGTERIYEVMQFSQAVRVGDTMWVSGQVGVDEKGNAGEGIEAQARLAFKNLESILTHAGGSMADIVELVTFHTSMADIGGFAQVKSEFIPENYPAWTAVGVTELARPQFLVEIRATAVIGSGGV